MAADPATPLYTVTVPLGSVRAGQSMWVDSPIRFVRDQRGYEVPTGWHLVTGVDLGGDEPAIFIAPHAVKVYDGEWSPVLDALHPWAGCETAERPWVRPGCAAETIWLTVPQGTFRVRVCELAPTDHPLPLGLAEIARYLDRARATVDGWRSDGLLPDPDGEVGGRPAWWPETIQSWAVETGRFQ